MQKGMYGFRLFNFKIEWNESHAECRPLFVVMCALLVVNALDEDTNYDSSAAILHTIIFFFRAAVDIVKLNLQHSEWSVYWRTCMYYLYNVSTANAGRLRFTCAIKFPQNSVDDRRIADSISTIWRQSTTQHFTAFQPNPMNERKRRQKINNENNSVAS